MTTEQRMNAYIKFCHELYLSPIYSKGDLYGNIQYFAERKLGLEYFSAVELGMKGRDIIMSLRKIEKEELPVKEFAVKFIKTFVVLSKKKAS